jgi:hypothetical protein
LKLRIFKSAIIFLVLLSAVIMLAACGKSDNGTEALSESDLKFLFNDKYFELDSDVQPLLAELGSDYDFSEAPSCVYEGTDKSYEYQGIAIYTYPLNGKDLIDEIILYGSEFETSRGIRVGSSKDEIIKAYGEQYIEEGDMITYRLNVSESDSPCIYFVMSNGMVESISFYSASNM